ncbi:TonB-dependent receptor [Marinivivus vitaminiproducens]|uniref:TonB-dependent receptor n=1 Tax=Marinivivus vitaminiproducens TaxID=3035935 RepID=UPI00279F27EF|nr:TonB-dependent receptor [Geminicoccaceae bacterium SCSIO 64248]
MSRILVRRALGTASLVALSTAIVSEAGAQQDATSPVLLDELTIYGARDTNTLRDTSSSVGVVTSEQIEAGEVRSFRDAFRYLGNVMDADWSDAGFVIRGVNSEGFVPGGAPLATMYIDGIQQSVNSARRGARGLWDVEQVEVYRGPQSTLSGRAAQAGAVYIKTKDPTFVPEGAISGTGGTDGLAGGAMMLNLPVVEDQVAVRLAGEYEKRDSDINYPTYEDFDRYDDYSKDEYTNLRAKVLVMPNALPDTQALLTYSFARDRPWTRDIGGQLLGFDLRDDRGDFNDPTFAEVRENKVHNGGIEITHDISDSLRFTSMTSMNLSRLDRPSINEGTPGEDNGLDGWQKQAYWTQEMRLNYERARWSWVSGVYGSYERDRGRFERTLGFGTPDSSNTRSESKIVTKNLAAFGEVTYEFVPTWRFTVGGRIDQTWQDNDQYIRQAATPGGPALSETDFSADTDETNFVPKIGIAKDLTPTQTVGFTYSRGFRTGGSGLNFTTGETYSYDPETSDNYEIFYKGSFLGDRLRVNSNIFYTKFDDQQVETANPLDALDSEIQNAGSSESYGFEFEPSFAVTSRFSTFLSVGYVHTEFDDFNDATFGDYSGESFPEAPEWTVAMGGRYDFDSGFYVGGDVKYTSSYLARFGNGDPIDRIDSRTITNMQAGYQWRNFEATLFVENLFDHRYYTYRDRVDLGFGARDTAATLGESRLIGLTLTASF